MSALSDAQDRVKVRYEHFTKEGPLADESQHLVAATLVLAEELAALRFVVESQVRLQTSQHNLV